MKPHACEAPHDVASAMAEKAHLASLLHDVQHEAEVVHIHQALLLYNGQVVRHDSIKDVVWKLVWDWHC